MTTSIYHEGERAVQRAAGETAIADQNGVVVTATILGGARPFLHKQFMAVLASIDAEGMPWSSVLYGDPGFIQLDGASALAIAMAPDRRDPLDPLWDNIGANPALGMLFIELGSRRRYRINGSVEGLDEQGVHIGVREAYPNCPRYIQRRQLRAMGGDTLPALLDGGNALSGDARDILHRADTVFVASNHAQAGADASHRGGNPGFVQLVGEGRLRLPDYPGNSLFNTFGNLAVDPRVGLCIPDFDGQRLLQLCGRARLLFDQDDPGGQSAGTRRFWEIEVERWLLRRMPRRLDWEYLDASPFNPAILES